MVLSVPRQAEMLFAFPLQQTVTGEGHRLGQGRTVLTVSRGTKGRRHVLASPDQTGARTEEGRGGAHASPSGQCPDNPSHISWIFNYTSEVVHVSS